MSTPMLLVRADAGTTVGAGHVMRTLAVAQVYWYPHCERLGYERGLCPRAEDFYRRTVSIPLFPRMTDGEIATVIQRVRNAASEVL